jgi:hypothetical protein
MRGCVQPDSQEFLSRGVHPRQPIRRSDDALGLFVCFGLVPRLQKSNYRKRGRNSPFLRSMSKLIASHIQGNSSNWIWVTVFPGANFLMNILAPSNGSLLIPLPSLSTQLTAPSRALMEKLIVASVVPA